jgi:hypothetical protein
MTTPCKPEEYADLKAELESIGYKLKPISRLQYNALLSRKKQLKQYNSGTVPKPDGDMKTVEPGYKSTTFTLDEDEAPKQASSQDCVRQAKAWKAAGIQPRAKSVKQISACADCTYFKKNGGSKSCGLYGLPVVGNAAELAAVVNRMTAGVPAESKRAALVQIANRLPQQNAPKAASVEAPFVRQASFTKERQYGFVEAEHLSGAKIQKLHAAGHTLKVICAAAEKKFGALEVSKAVREFVASLRKEKGKIIVAAADADFLKKMGIHNEAIVGAAKCASCKAHGKEMHKTSSSTEMVTRAPEAFVQATPGHIRSAQKKVIANFDSAVVAKYHAAGHSVDKIYKAASVKYGSAQASKAIRDWAHNLKNTDTKIALSQIDCTVLKKMGVKLSSKNAIIGAEKCGSCSYRNGMHCGLTGGTLLSYPGMNQTASNKKVAVGAPVDGRSMLKEFDLMGKTAQADIDMAPPERADIHGGSAMSAGNISVTADSVDDGELYTEARNGDALARKKFEHGTPSGFFVEGKEWDSVPPQRPGYYEENPPDDWEDCGGCGGYHPAGYTGDCRSDINRWPSEKSIAAMSGKVASKTAEWKGWTEDMPVQVVGVSNGQITPDGRGVQEFANLAEAKAVFPDLDPNINGQRFCWAMAGSIKGMPAIRFETWPAEEIYSR